MGAQRTILAIMIIVLLAPFAPAALAGTQDDAGLGGDAPDVWQEAAPLALGTYRGTLGPWEYQSYVDQYDWYVVDVPQGEWLHVEVQRLGEGVHWVNVEALDATGARLDFFSYPYTTPFAIDVKSPGGAVHVAVWLYAGNPEVEYSLTLALVGAEDAGGPGDAPDAAGAARQTELGAYAGLLDPDAGDSADWYRISLPDDKGLLVVLEPWNGNARVEAIGEGTWYRQTRDNGWVWPRDLYIPRHADHFLIGVNSTGGGGSYNLRFELLDLPDLRIVDVRDGTEVLAVDSEEPEEARLQRDVVVEVENVGEGPTRYATRWGWSQSAELAVWTSAPQPGGGWSTRWLGRYTFDLAAGESVEIHVPWDTTGQVGEQVLHAGAWTRFESDFADNRRDVRVVPVEGAPQVGVDLLNAAVWTPAHSATLHQDARAEVGGGRFATAYGSCWRGGQDSYEMHAWVATPSARLNDRPLAESNATSAHPKDCDGWVMPERPLAPPPLPTPRERMASATVGDLTYLIGGRGQDGYLADVLAFSTMTETALPVPAILPSPRAGAAAATDGVFVYLFGGEGPNGFLDEIVRYDPLTGGVVTMEARLPTPRHGSVAIFDARASLACPTGCIYVFGGIDMHEEPWWPHEVKALSLDDVLRFEPVSGTLTLLDTQMPRPTIVGPTAWDGERLSFFGLVDDWSASSVTWADAWFYDPFTDEGEHHDQWFYRRDGGVAFWLDDIAYQLGGAAATEWDEPEDGLAWDPSYFTSAWLDESIARAFRDGVAVPVEGGAYLIGGRDPVSGELGANVERWRAPHEWWRD